MSMELNDFLFSPIPEVKDLAERAVRVESMYNNGDLTLEEYKDLAEDILSLKVINEEMVDLEAQRELWQVVNVLKNLKFFASLV